MILAQRKYETGIVSLEWNDETDQSIVQIVDRNGTRGIAAENRKDAADLYLHTSLFEDRFETVLDLSNIATEDRWEYDQTLGCFVREAT